MDYRLVPSLREELRKAWPPGDHCNRLGRDAFLLPGSGENLLDVLDEALSERIESGVWVLGPIGSIVYARRDGEVLWDLVRDIDVWCYLEDEDRIADGGWLRELEQSIGRALPGSVPVEIRVGQLRWLADGVRSLDREPITARKPPLRPHPEDLRPEWAVYRPFEDYFPSPAAVDRFEEIVRGISGYDVLRQPRAGCG